MSVFGTAPNTFHALRFVIGQANKSPSPPGTATVTSRARSCRSSTIRKDHAGRLSTRHSRIGKRRLSWDSSRPSCSGRASTDFDRRDHLVRHDRTGGPRLPDAAGDDRSDRHAGDFVPVTAVVSQNEKARIARRAVIYGGLVLIGFLIAGELLLSGIGVRLVSF